MQYTKKITLTKFAECPDLKYHRLWVRVTTDNDGDLRDQIVGACKGFPIIGNQTKNESPYEMSKGARWTKSWS